MAGQLAALYDRSRQAEAFLRGCPWELTFGRSDGGPPELPKRITPRSAFLAVHLALLLHMPEPTTDPSIEDWLMDVVTGARAGTTRCCRRPFASAVRAVNHFADDLNCGDDDPFQTWNLCEVLEDIEWNRDCKAARPRIDSLDWSDLYTRTPWDFDQRVLAYGCGFDRIEPPKPPFLGDDYGTLAGDIARSVAVRRELRTIRARPLAKSVLDRASPSELVELGEELRSEFAAARIRLPRYLSHARVLPTAMSRGREDRPARNHRDPRGRFAHRLLRNRGTKSYKVCLNRFNSEASRRGWENVSSIQGLIHIARSFAQRRRIPPGDEVST
ncbi:MAG TPA: hypothetical protein VKE40_22080 [Gemmataceae bacterium]|nr:hypothetical protein [Gemmataceae bacterium]